MDFHLTDEQEMLRESARRFLEKECSLEQRLHAPVEGGFDAARWSRFADMGWLAASLPEDCGGLGGDIVEAALLMEEFGRTLVVDPFWGIGVLAAQTLLAADAEKARELLPLLCAGELRPALAHHELQSRGVIEHVTTQARPAGDGAWTLHGEKTLVMGGNVADRFIVSARTAGDSRDRDGITLFLIDANAPGLQRRDVRLIDNRWTAEITLDRVQVTAADLLGEVGQGWTALEYGHARGLIALCAEAVGVMERAMWITRDYLRTRKQFGVTLNTFQALQHRMAEMLIELELSRSMVYRAMAYLARPLAARQAALSVTKARVGQSGRFVCAHGIQLHGGIGVTEEYSIGHYFKRMTVFENELGSAQFHLEQLALCECAEPVAARP
ncbi:MAG: putative acyl-CoA dehydrogenase [Hydrocarboniphaga sp.]|uniref:acyl-CoA dehydrogenase family protein n=1 Tax=Hydrocarboniphaga sp. TaxID=2033016 RepID=UPI00262F24ED|nr:acyl-CoA dehydrogenase family protein [Hydrocarboniphaga sp.]MDB5971426.1 putative acyl-CoA dehydrogenase [Hydrocarboniphaga sp.]